MAVDSQIRGAVELLAVGDQFIPKAVEGLSREELLKRPSPGSSPMLWLWGHVTNTRSGLLNMLGVEHPRFHPDLFGKGADSTDDSKYPDVGEVAEAWQAVSAALHKRLAEVDDAFLSQDAPRKFRNEDASYRGAIWYLTWHEGIHLGQMGYVRKWLGEQSLFG